MFIRIICNKQVGGFFILITLIVVQYIGLISLESYYIKQEDESFSNKVIELQEQFKLDK